MESNLADSLAHNARARPDHTALVDGDRSLTHAQLHDDVQRLAHALMSDGLQSGDILGLCLRDSLEHVVCMWACIRAGLVMLPLDWRWTAAERESVVSHFQARRVICEPGVTFDACATLTWEQLQAPSAAASAHALPITSLASPLLISLSSGTTGRPKGPMITHRHFLRRFHTHWINLGLNANSRYVNATPLYFGGGRTFVLSVLFSGGTVILHGPPFEPDSLAQVVQQHDANALFMVPTQLRRLLTSPPEIRAAFGRLQLLISSGAPLQPRERSAIRGDLCARFYEYYASTEGGGVTLCTPEDFDRHLTSVGRAIYGVEVGIVDASDAAVETGVVGHLRYRGPGVADAFFNDAAQSQHHFRDGWFYPGDLAELDRQGYLYLRGRSNDTVIRGGVNVHPSEVEATLLQLPKLHDCSVFGIADADLGERLACAWVGDADLTSLELETHCRTALARYKIPSVWLRLDELPRNSAGKVLKVRLKELVENA